MHTLFLVTIYFKYELILTSKDRTHNSLKKSLYKGTIKKRNCN